MRSLPYARDQRRVATVYMMDTDELWEFAANGLMARREASINDVPVDESERRVLCPRPASEYGVEFPLR